VRRIGEQRKIRQKKCSDYGGEKVAAVARLQKLSRARTRSLFLCLRRENQWRKSTMNNSCNSGCWSKNKFVHVLLVGPNNKRENADGGASAHVMKLCSSFLFYAVPQLQRVHAISFSASVLE